MKGINKYIWVLFFCTILGKIYGQQPVWANKLLEFSEYFQFENNLAEYVLGPPKIYPGVSLDDPHDPYSEGYILHYVDEKIKNQFVVGFSKPMNAKQIIVGGIFNVGTIEEIYVVLKDKKEKLVYKETRNPSKVKFKSFATFIPYNTVYGVRIKINHRNINNWNIIKGIGILNSDKLYYIKPDVIEDTSHTHERVKVGEKINSSDCFEFSPKIAPDGKTLYFVKECEGQDDQDIWYTQKDSVTGEWQEAKNIGVPLNNKGHNFVASISPDGQTLLIGNKYNPDGTDGGDGVSISHRTEDGSWEIPKAVEIPGYKNTNDHANFYMNNDGNVILMAIQDEKSVGSLDLYASIYQRGIKQWSAPINLGSMINTAFQEDYPYLANDGKTLFFSSKGHIGYGGMDIFVSTRLDESWTNWSKPQNLGAFVNSKADDKGFMISSEGDHAYFNSAPFDTVSHHMDIYRVNLPKMLHQTPRILLSGYCTDQKTKEPLRATMSLRNELGELIVFGSSNPKTGYYLMSVEVGKKYELMGEAIEYFKIKEPLVLTGTGYGLEMKKNYAFMHFIDTGVVMKMENLLFAYNSGDILPESYASLNGVVDIMKQQKKATFEISGHTDNVGSHPYNQKLSEDRVASVVNYLTSKGIENFRIKSKAYGETMPIADNETEEGRTMNRRVEFKVLEKDYTIHFKPKSTKAKTKTVTAKK
ncbi:MAG: OmpA family protein [Bacteroidota bacterium]|nr:OmpA family protein [Bacteroidota bacterium]